MVTLRASQPVLRRRMFLNGRRPGIADVLWLRPDGREMEAADWADPERRVLGVLLDGGAITETDPRGQPIVGDTLLILLNAGADEVRFVLPKRKAGGWTHLIDTADPEYTTKKIAGGQEWRLQPHSAAAFSQKA